jgi:hypothetical protein
MSSLCQFTFAIAIAAIASPLGGVTQERATVQGEWILNRDLTPALPTRDDMKRPDGPRPPGGRGGPPAGGGGFGGGLGNGPGGGRRGPSEEEIRKLEAVRRRIDAAPQRLVISIEGTRVQLVDELGRATNLVADGKKQQRLTGDGEFKSVTRLEGARLVVEEDFGGPKVTTTYERITSDGESRLQVTLQVDGTPEGPGDRGHQSAKVPITRIYDSRK